MSLYTYWTKEGKFETDDYSFIPFEKVHSPDENTPAIVHTHDNHKMYYFNGKRHRLTGPANVYPSGEEFFYLNDTRYEFEDWLKMHLNQDISFQTKMKLQYT